MAAQKLIAIVGPTASGKSDLAMELAVKFNGEIICADSRTVYKGMDIATAKPSKEDQAKIPHHLLDVAEPGEQFSVADFKVLAEQAIKDIQRRGKLPIVVGGSGLYISVLLYNFQLLPPASAAFRAQLDKLTTPQLLERLAESDPEVAQVIDTKNRRRIIRAIETAGLPKVRLTTLRPNTLLIGLRLNKDLLRKRIEQRAENMIQQGLLEEVKTLGEKYGWNSEAMTGIAYRAFKHLVLKSEMSGIDEAKREFIRGDLALAKKQMTWFKRDPNIQWVESPNQAIELAKEFLG